MITKSKLDNAQIADLAKRCLMMEEEMFQELSKLLQSDLTGSDVDEAEARRIKTILSIINADTERHSKFDRELLRRYGQGTANE